MVDSTQGNTLVFSGTVAVDSAAQVTGVTDCGPDGTVGTITTTLTYELFCSVGSPPSPLNFVI